MKKRLLSATLLALCMVFLFLSPEALAAGNISNFKKVNTSGGGRDH